METVLVFFVKLKTKPFHQYLHRSMPFSRYCLSQPNAMKFLAQNHAFNWESYKDDLGQLHLVPCEFIAEIFHRALHCFGLEKRVLKETLSIDSSPSNRLGATYFTEYVSYCLHRRSRHCSWCRSSLLSRKRWETSIPLVWSVSAMGSVWSTISSNGKSISKALSQILMWRSSASGSTWSTICVYRPKQCSWPKKCSIAIMPTMPPSLALSTMTAAFYLARLPPPEIHPMFS